MDQQEKTNLLQDIILNTRKPLVFKNFPTNWKCFDSSIEKWCAKYDAYLDKKENVIFEQMPTKFGDSPQWERYRSRLKTTFTDFIKHHTNNTNKWASFCYKSLDSIPKECRHDVDFRCFGFPNNINDASFWLSSKGANTPCHYDTYGCNIVVQVYGRKHWLLFPPETKLTPVRVPYEESSVYCSENFYSPKNLEQFAAVRGKAFECILEQGDVLIVPRNWWHYVESLETSLSVNSWIPLKIDVDAQIQECIVKIIIENSLRDESDETKSYILNPNQLQLIASREELFEILKILVENESSDSKYSYEYLSEEEVNQLIEKCLYHVKPLQLLHAKEFDSIMLERTKRYMDMEFQGPCVHPMNEALLNAICHPNSINKIKEELLKTMT